MRVDLDRGSIAPLGSAMLAFLLAVSLGIASAGHAALTANRLQSIADAGALYVNDRAESQAAAEALTQRFVRIAEIPNFQGSQVDWASGITELRLCAAWRDPLRVFQRVVCRRATAKSFALE